MRAPSALLAFLALAGSLLAGCTGPSEPTGDGITTLPVIRRPDDFTSANATAPGSHIHDYWGGRDTVEVLREERGPMEAVCQGCTDGMVVGRFLPEEGAIVPQGTRWVNVTLDVEGAGSKEGYEVWVQTTQDGEAWRVGPITPGGQVSIEGTQARNDPPHYVRSLWVFELRIPGADSRFDGSFTLAATAQRGLPLVPYPPHPDRWDGATELDLLAETVDAQTLEYETPTGWSVRCYAGCPRIHGLPNGTVVPHDATTVQVRLLYQPGSLPAGLELAYHGADTRQFKPLTPEGATPTPGEQAYTIPLSPNEGDSPYAPRSLWAFDVWLDDTAPARAWAGTYELHVKALK